MLAKSKLNSIEALVLQALIDMEISHDPPGMRRRSDVSFLSHLGWDVTDHIETSSRPRY